MNIRKSVDYSAMFVALDKLMSAELPQMRLYYEIGRLVSDRPEKGAAVAAAKDFQIASAATSPEEIGHPVYPPARRKLAEYGIRYDGHSARQLTNRDYDEYDLLIGMDQANLRNMYRVISAPRASLRSVALRNGACGRSCGGDYAGKMHLLPDFTDRQKGPQ